MSKLVIVDSQIFIWGIKLDDNEKQALDVQRSRTLIAMIEQKKEKIVIPTPQLAELLSGCNPEKRQDLLGLIARRYQVVPFDNMTAVKFGELMHATLKDTELRQYFKEKNTFKARMKFDCMIVATGITRGVKCIYSHDSDLSRYSLGQIPIRHLSSIPAQLEVFPQIEDLEDE